MFKITSGKGFHITFQNGWTVSVQWGPGNYCENRNFSVYSQDADREAGKQGSENAEIMVWNHDGNSPKISSHDTVRGWVTPDSLIEVLGMIQQMDASTPLAEIEKNMQEIFSETWEDDS